MNMQELLISYFRELDPDIKEIVADIYSLEREFIDFYDSPYGIKGKIRDIIDRVAKEQLRNLSE